MKLLKGLLNKFIPACNGVKLGLYNRGIRIQYMIALFVIIVTLFLDFNVYEWIYVILSCSLVITIEILNTTVEEIINILFPEYNENAKKIKDLAAGAVMVISIGVLLGYLLILKGKWL